MIQILIPTYNRPICIKNMFEYGINKYKGNLFRFTIYDSSEGNETSTIVCQNIKQYQLNSVLYVRCDSRISPDLKMMTAIQNVEEEFFWIIGDGNLVDFYDFEKFLLRNKYNFFDVINVEHIYRINKQKNKKRYNRNIIYQYNDSIEFAKKYFSHLTYWGATIIRTKFFEITYKKGSINKYIYKKIPWWIACLIFEACEFNLQLGTTVNLGTVYSSYVSYNPAKSDHGWTKGNQYYDYVFTKFNQAIDMLPETYNDVKKDIITCFRNDSLVSNSYLLYLRSKRVLTLNLIREYYDEIEVVPGFYHKMCLYSLLPIRMAIIGEYIKKFLKRLFID